MLSQSAGTFDPKEILRALINGKIEFVLVGAHAIGGWTREPRATQDVDVVVRRGQQQKAVRAIRKLDARLKAQDLAGVTRIFDPKTGQTVVDLIKPKSRLLQAVFDNSEAVGEHRIPTLEMSLALKYSAMLSPHRAMRHKLKDAADFAALVETNGDFVDRAKLLDLAKLIHATAPKRIEEAIGDVMCGRPPRLQ